MKMKLLAFAMLGFFSAGTFASCGEGNEEEEVTREDVYEQFDDNSPRPSIEEEYQEDSATVEGAPVEAE